MPLDFIFCDESHTDKAGLFQGDLLKKTTELGAAIGQAHAYYATTASYSHFMVLTQSCDLVRRNGKIKSDYIVIAAVRPLQDLLARRILKRSISPDGVPLRIFPKDQEDQVRQFLERLLHNTEDGFFFIPKTSLSAIDVDLCAFLQLSIALRVEHFQVCLNAKIAQLSDVFQAKLGWLAGNNYSRVGTPDLEEHVADPQAFKSEFFDEVLFGESAWLTSEQLRHFKAGVREWRVANPGTELTIEQSLKLIANVPPQFDILASRVVDLLVGEGIVANNADERKKVTNRIRNDDALLKMARSVR